MSLSKKQEIYLQIMDQILPYMRNVQRHSSYRRLRAGSFFAELELVHNLSRCLACAEFTETDGFWLGSQGRQYIQTGRRELPFYDRVRELIRELDALLPTEIRERVNPPKLD